MFRFFDAGVSVAYDLVTVLVHVLTPVAGVLAAPAAIVVFTIAVRLLLVPLSFYALRGQAAQARLQPRLAELRRRHAGQPDQLQREIAALYQREGGGLLAGCLPVLVQLPFFSVMYRLFRSRTIGGRPNALLTHSLLGAPLGAHWLSGAGPASGQGLVFAGLFVLLGLAGWVSARLARRAAEPAPAQPGGPDAAARITAAAAALLPFTTVVIAMFVPLAAGLYLLTITWWAAAERAALRRRVQLSLTRNANVSLAGASGRPAGQRELT
jgi:YidC/Oxa1 family membrane protein insertase